jgi:hypothetical protein
VRRYGPAFKTPARKVRRTRGRLALRRSPIWVQGCTDQAELVTPRGPPRYEGPLHIYRLLTTAICRGSAAQDRTVLHVDEVVGRPPRVAQGRSLVIYITKGGSKKGRDSTSRLSSLMRTLNQFFDEYDPDLAASVLHHHLVPLMTTGDTSLPFDMRDFFAFCSDPAHFTADFTENQPSRPLLRIRSTSYGNRALPSYSPSRRTT